MTDLGINTEVEEKQGQKTPAKSKVVEGQKTLAKSKMVEVGQKTPITSKVVEGQKNPEKSKVVEDVEQPKGLTPPHQKSKSKILCNYGNLMT